MFSEEVREFIKARIDAMNDRRERRDLETFELLGRMARGENVEFPMPENRLPFRVVPEKVD